MAICLTAQFVVRPGIVCGICLLFGLTDKLAIGFMLCSMAPGGNGSNLLELIFRGNVELGIVCTLFSSVFAAIAIPVDFYVYARRFSEDSFTFASMPWVDMMLAIICVFTGAVAGAVVRYRDDERGAWLEKRAAGLGLLLLVAAVAIAVATNARALAMIPGNAWLAAVFPCPVALGCGYVPSRLAGLGQVEARTVAIEIAEANIGVAYAILLLMYDDEDDRTKVFAGLVAYTIFNEVYIFSVAAYWRCAAPIERPPRDTSFRKQTLDASTGDPEDPETGGLDLAMAAPADGGDAEENKEEEPAEERLRRASSEDVDVDVPAGEAPLSAAAPLDVPCASKLKLTPLEVAVSPPKDDESDLRGPEVVDSPVDSVAASCATPSTLRLFCSTSCTSATYAQVDGSTSPRPTLD